MTPRTPRALAAATLAVALAAAGYAATRAAATPSAADLLRRSAKAGASWDYQGTKRLVFHGGDQPSEMILKVIHLRPDRTRTEFLGPGRMSGVLRMEIGKAAWRYDPKAGQWRPSIARDAEAMNLVRLLANYTVTELRTDRVAGRRSHLVAIRPKRAGNPSRRVWVDAATSLPLRIQSYGAGGRLISESAFSQITFSVPKSARGLLRPPQRVPEPSPPPTLDFEPVKPSYLPPGYGPVATTTLAVRGRATCHLRYSDGLGTISLFEERREAAPPERTHPREPGERTHRREHREFPSALRWGHGEMRYTLIGDVSPEQLARLAASLPGGENARPPRPPAPGGPARPAP